MPSDNQVARGSLSPVKDRQSDKHPGMKGSLTFSRDVKAGEKVWLAAWTKVGDDGGKWISINAEVSNKNPQAAKPAPKAQQHDEDEDSIPF